MNNIVNQRTAIARMGALQDFTAAALSAQTYGPTPYGLSTSNMDANDAADLDAAAQTSAVYVVRSYSTPIAWVALEDTSAARVVTRKYSVTTSRHQTYARRGLSAYLRATAQD